MSVYLKVVILNWAIISHLALFSPMSVAHADNLVDQVYHDFLKINHLDKLLYKNTVNLTISSVSLTNDSVNVGEDGQVVSIEVIRSENTDSAVSVEYHFENGSAFNGLDYNGNDGTLNFDSGVTSQFILIDIVVDTEVEGLETFYLTISNPINAVLGDIQSAEVAIIDNDYENTPPSPEPFNLNTIKGSEGGGALGLLYFPLFLFLINFRKR